MVEFLYILLIGQTGQNCELDLLVNEHPVIRYQLYDGIPNINVLSPYLIKGGNTLRLQKASLDQEDCDVSVELKSYQKGIIVTPEGGREIPLFLPTNTDTPKGVFLKLPFEIGKKYFFENYSSNYPVLSYPKGEAIPDLETKTFGK